MSFAAVIFDFDGTLVDSYPAIAASVNHVRAAHRLPPLAVDEVTGFVGRGPEYLLTRTVPGGNVAENIARYRAHHPTIMKEGTRLLPGASDVLRGLSAQGKRLGLCSNKPRLFSEQLLAHLGIAGHFAVVLGPEDVPRPKPAPDMLLAAIAQMKVSPRRMLYVGDMTVDIEAARAAGVTVWVIPTGSDHRAALAAARPDRLLDRLTDLVPLLTEPI